MDGEVVTIAEILAAKDKRVAILTGLSEQYAGSLLSFKLNIPGAVKDNQTFRRLYEEGVKVFRKQLDKNKGSILFEEKIYCKTGAEYFAVIAQSPLEIKQLVVEMEENHPLGRIFDFDVLDEHLHQISRTALGESRRKCLICEEDAFICSRSKNHDIASLLAKINSLSAIYFSGK